MLTALSSVSAILFCVTGCTGVSTMSAETFAAQVSSHVDDNIGVIPEVDCGDTPIQLSAGAIVECVLTDPGTKDRFRADVEITHIGTGNMLDLELSVDPDAL